MELRRQYIVVVVPSLNKIIPLPFFLAGVVLVLFLFNKLIRQTGLPPTLTPSRSWEMRKII